MGPTYYCDVWTVTSIEKNQNETNKQEKPTAKMVSSFPPLSSWKETLVYWVF